MKARANRAFTTTGILGDQVVFKKEVTQKLKPEY